MPCCNCQCQDCVESRKVDNYCLELRKYVKIRTTNTPDNLKFLDITGKEIVLNYICDTLVEGNVYYVCEYSNLYNPYMCFIPKSTVEIVDIIVL